MSLADTMAVPALSRRRLLVLSAGTALGAVSAGAAVAVVAPGRASAVAPKEVSAATGAFLDPLTVHEIAVTFDQGTYDAMVETFSSSGEKEWIEATVAIDGATYEKAGMRLKGNSSLGGLIGRIEGPGADQDVPVAGSDLPDDAGVVDQSDEQGFVDRPDRGADFEAPERLPWLIRLDKFVDGQQHDGFRELVIRSNRSQTSLNEAVALDLLAKAGLASQLAAYAGFSVNGSASALRLAVEHPNEEWMALRFSRDGLLYKGESTGDYSYRGDDPDAYDEVFDLEAGGSGDKDEDMVPLIEFLAFLNNSDDQTFAGEIEARLDVPQFAVYLAMMDLIGNFDGIDGPGNNGYLYLDPDSGQFTVVPWDMNLAFGGMGSGPGADAGGAASATPAAANDAVGGGPVVRTCGPDGECVDGPGDFAGGPSGGPNPLVERFTAIAGYATLIDDEASRLRAALYDSGAADEALARWVGVLEAGAGTMVDQATIASEDETVASYFTPA